MVVTVFWMESWTVVIISLCVLTTIGIILLCCICWETKKKSNHHFYILDENGLKEVTSEVSNNNVLDMKDSQRAKNLFRHLPSGDSFKNNFTSKILSTVEKRKNSSESDLIQSIEIADKFNHSVLRLEENDINNFVASSASRDKEEDLKSCISDESKYTFYSMYMGRSTSATGTIRSALSQPYLNCAD